MKKHHANDDGWCDWVTPIMTGYRMACCDCGLVHDVQFQVMRVTSKNANGTFEALVVDKDRYRVAMRMKRNNRSTGQLRRKR